MGVLRLLFTVFLLTVASSSSQGATVSPVDEERAINATQLLIQRLEADTPIRIGNPSAKLVRLLFHDCVTGCDGCVDLGNPENNGLSGIYQEVNTLYDSEFASSGMSRADFIALQAVVAVRVAAEEQSCMQLQLPPDCVKPRPEMIIRYGRKDCATSPNSTNDFGFPDAHRGFEHVMAIFRDGMGMSERQVVALIGAHTLGSASPENSGFRGPWSPPTNRFDNAFYRTLMAAPSGWRQNELNLNNAPAGFNPRYQWDSVPQNGPGGGGGTRMMLNTDMALLKNITPDGAGRETDVSCRTLFTNCPDSRTADIVREYALNNTRWHEDFGPAFQILLGHGYPDDHLVRAGQNLSEQISANVSTPTQPTAPPSTMPATQPTTPPNNTVPSAVSRADENRAIEATEQLIQRLETEMPVRIRNPSAKLVRLLFHDYVTGCDGCVDLGNPENNGLSGIYQEVNTLYDSEFASSGMSRADFIALQAVVAVRVAAEEQSCMQLQLPPGCVKPRPEMFIRYGRIDCATSPNSSNDTGFPDAHRAFEHVMEVFRDGMRMSERQVVALIGAHTLGLASPENSGFRGPWSPPTNRFDNAFYRTLMAAPSGWRQNELNLNNAPAGFNPRYQWDSVPQNGPGGGGGTRMMLNTDMALLKNITPDGAGRETDVSCRTLFTNCPDSRTADIVREYALNNTRWHEDFGPAFQILLENGYPDNHLVAADQILPTIPTDSAIGLKGAFFMVMVGVLISLMLL